MNVHSTDDDQDIIDEKKTREVQDDQQACCSWKIVAPPRNNVSLDSETKEVPEENPTPGKMLDSLSPVLVVSNPVDEENPVVSTPVDSVRRRSKRFWQIEKLSLKRETKLLKEQSFISVLKEDGQPESHPGVQSGTEETIIKTHVPTRKGATRRLLDEKSEEACLRANETHI
ncbi:hypothetical protein FQA39_LY10548 [Lamprigera yunnana]|nr:hypothetical protein FQA39_LY10548 [Lamprigera yunnana]